MVWDGFCELDRVFCGSIFIPTCNVFYETALIDTSRVIFPTSYFSVSFALCGVSLAIFPRLSIRWMFVTLCSLSYRVAVCF